MKTITHGKVQYKRCENVFDINDYRFNDFKSYILQVFEKMDKPVFETQFNKYLAQFNKGQHAEALIDWNNYKKARELKELNYDAYSFCYALMHLAEGEDALDCSKDTQLKKLTQMREAGLSRGEVEEVVTNFMRASPASFGVYLEMLEQTTESLVVKG